MSHLKKGVSHNQAVEAYYKELRKSGDKLLASMAWHRAYYLGLKRELKDKGIVNGRPKSS